MRTDREKILFYHSQGCFNSDISKKTGLSGHDVLRILHKEKLKSNIRDAKKYLNDQDRAVMDFYRQGKSFKEIAELAEIKGFTAVKIVAATIQRLAVPSDRAAAKKIRDEKIEAARNEKLKDKKRKPKKLEHDVSDFIDILPCKKIAKAENLRNKPLSRFIEKRSKYTNLPLRDAVNIEAHQYSRKKIQEPVALADGIKAVMPEPGYCRYELHGFDLTLKKQDFLWCPHPATHKSYCECHYLVSIGKYVDKKQKAF